MRQTKGPQLRLAPLREITNTHSLLPLQQIRQKKQNDSKESSEKRLSMLIQRKMQLEQAVKDLQGQVNFMNLSQTQEISEALAQSKQLSVQQRALEQSILLLQGQLQNILNQTQEKHLKMELLKRQIESMPSQLQQCVSSKQRLVQQFNILLANYQRQCQIIAQLKKDIHQRTYNLNKLFQQLQKITAQNQLQDRDACHLHQLILNKQSQNRTIQHQIQQTPGMVSDFVEKVKAKKEETLSNRRKAEEIKSNLVASLASESKVLTDTLTALRADNNAFQKNQHFATRKVQYLDQQILHFNSLLLSLQNQLTESQLGSGVRSLRHIGEEMLRTDLRIRKWLQECQGRVEGGQLQKIRLRRNRLVQKCRKYQQ